MTKTLIIPKAKRPVKLGVSIPVALLPPYAKVIKAEDMENGDLEIVMEVPDDGPDVEVL
jgi:hypothetical protein